MGEGCAVSAIASASGLWMRSLERICLYNNRLIISKISLSDACRWGEGYYTENEKNRLLTPCSRRALTRLPNLLDRS